jgi:hypothetical protein
MEEIYSRSCAVKANFEISAFFTSVMDEVGDAAGTLSSNFWWLIPPVPNLQ